MSAFDEAEFAALKIAFEKEKKARVSLEEECDLLAFDNDRLNGELAKLKAIVESNSWTDKKNSSDTGTAEKVDIFVDGDNKYANTLSRKILDSNGGKNVLSTSFLVDGNDDILLSGGVDGCLNGFSDDGLKLFSYVLTAPVLAIDVHDLTIACSLMDGGLSVIELASQQYEHQVVTTFKDHSKYVVAVKFSADGAYLATASHDKSVNVYHRNATSGDFEKVKTIQFSHTPEALLFALNSTPPVALVAIEEGEEVAVSLPVVVPTLSQYELIIGLRGVGHLVYLDTESFEQRLVSLNENDWDTHVSFTPLYLSTSPDGKLLLIATDKSLHFIVKIGTSHRVRTLAGHCCGDYGKPSVAWDCTGGYIFCNSDEDSAVFVYSLASERVVDRLSRGHKGIVRGVACHPTKRLVLSASYDKSLVLWDYQKQGTH